MWSFASLNFKALIWSHLEPSWPTAPKCHLPPGWLLPTATAHYFHVTQNRVTAGRSSFQKPKGKQGIPEANWSFRHSSPSSAGGRTKSPSPESRLARREPWRLATDRDGSAPRAAASSGGRVSVPGHRDEGLPRKAGPGLREEREGGKRGQLPGEGGSPVPGQALCPSPRKVMAIWEMMFFNCILTEFLHLPTK